MDWGVPGRKRVEEKSQLFFCLQLIRVRNYFQAKFFAVAFVDVALDDIKGEVHSVGGQQVLSNWIGN